MSSDASLIAAVSSFTSVIRAPGALGPATLVAAGVCLQSERHPVIARRNRSSGRTPAFTQRQQIAALPVLKIRPCLLGTFVGHLRSAALQIGQCGVHFPGGSKTFQFNWDYPNSESQCCRILSVGHVGNEEILRRFPVSSILVGALKPFWNSF